MSEVTKVGVGSFWDAGEIPITIPGQVEQVTVACQWGPGLGFILLFGGIVLLLIWQARKPLQNIVNRFHISSLGRK